MANVLLPLLVALVLGLTLPGTSLGAEYLGPGVVKVAGVALLLLFHRRLITLFGRTEYVRFILLLFVYLLYRTIHSTVMDTHWVLPWVSLVWMLIVAGGLSQVRRVRLFTLYLLLPLFVLILSPGLDRIFNLSRGIAHDQFRESLRGLAESYNIYAMSALAGYFLSMTAFLMTRRLYLRALYGFAAIVAFIGTATSGSRGGMVSIISGSCIYLILFQFMRRRRNATMMISAYLIVVLLIVIVPWDNVFYAVTSQDIHTGSTALRWFLMKTSYRMALERPVFGWGWEGVRVRVLNTTHCGWLQIWAELGLVGLALEIALWAVLIRFSLRTHWRAERRGDHGLVVLNLGYLGLFISYGVWQFVENISFAHGTRLHYMVAGSLLALYFSVVPVRGRSAFRGAAIGPPLPAEVVGRGRPRPERPIEKQGPLYS